MSQKTIVMNVKNRAITEYTNYCFNSLCCFNGRYLGANSSGIFPLSGDDDNGTAIDAHIKTATADVGKGQPKKLRDAWIFARKGLMTFTVIADEDNEFTYNADVENSKIHEERVKIGRGIKGRGFSFILANVDGSDFDIDNISVLTDNIRRAR